MELQVNLSIPKLPAPIRYGDKIMLTGSCFTEHIGNALSGWKFNVLQNPNGILFDPQSVSSSLVSYTENGDYKSEDLVLLNELWHSWQHHSRFSNIDRETALKGMNASLHEAHQFLKEADWLIITLGSSFSYRVKKDHTIATAVANCHRAPATWFDKHLLEIEETISLLDHCYHRLRRFNPLLRIMFTISPVRHLRDGVVDNNRSKARLIEAVHHMVNKFEGLYYFPAYELVIDVLRDYRFYDIDMAHPNYPATEFVLEKFTESCIDASAWSLMKELKKIQIAKKHRPMFASTNTHREFLTLQLEKAVRLQKEHEHLNMREEIDYFEKALNL